MLKLDGHAARIAVTTTMAPADFGVLSNAQQDTTNLMYPPFPFLFFLLCTLSFKDRRRQQFLV